MSGYDEYSELGTQFRKDRNGVVAPGGFSESSRKALSPRFVETSTLDGLGDQSVHVSNPVSSFITNGLTQLNIYGEVMATGGVESLICSYTVPSGSGNYIISGISFGGVNVAVFRLKVDGNLIGTFRTTAAKPTELISPYNGMLTLSSGQVVELFAHHNFIGMLKSYEGSLFISKTIEI